MRIKLWGHLPGPFVITSGSKPKRKQAEKLDPSDPVDAVIMVSWWLFWIILIFVVGFITMPLFFGILTVTLSLFVGLPLWLILRPKKRKRLAAEEEARKLERDNA